ncbi:Nap1 [Symbiodinium natans]|uniref:Nap1 protein n=1 Tax=Symbiodinium natans TaxID=878477 RepID=A0A812G075_9DINO|nr:Nap1 [Symbiodinium natans]
MAPRRGGGGGAGVETSSSLRGGLAPPPLKRVQPWLEDGSGQCDIVAGGVDASGVFKGIYVSGVHLAALLRTFQLSKAFLPVETPTPVQALGQSLQDGVPLVIVTRGCFGREMDIGNGPTRNDIQKAVWEAARRMRADMPQVLVTCIDVPLDAGSEVVNACLQAPLNEYRELLYHDGAWFTPAVYNASKLGQWVSNNPRELKPKGGLSFSRKKFEWNNKAYENMFLLGWKPVLES